MATFAERAAPLVGQGYPVFPCKRDKRPYVRGGFTAATKDRRQIAEWSNNWPDALVGVPTGKASGLFVLDVDVRDGKDGFQTLRELGWTIPETRTHRTQSGGAHYLFRMPADVALKSQAGRLGAGLDTRGEGGYIIWWPAHGGEVEHPDSLADVPSYLVDALQATRAAARVSLPGRDIPEGSRNDTLFHIAASLRGRGASVAAIEEALLSENAERCDPPLPEDEVRRIAQSVGRYDAGPTGWDKPQPLTAKIEPMPYPMDALPDTIRAAVEEVAGFTKAPVPLVASSALSVLSLACQGRVDVMRAEGLQGPVSLFMLTIAESGERKSTCDKYFVEPVRLHELEQADALEPAIREYQGAAAAWQAKSEGILAAIKSASKSGKDTGKLEADLIELEHRKPKPPRVPRLLLGDETPESLAWSLARQWPSAGVLSNEAGVVFGAHGMGKDSVMRNLALLNILWDGGELSVGRRTTESFTVRGARLTMGLMVQEATLRDYFHKTGPLARGTGFLARFLVAWPESTQGRRFYTDPPKAWPRLGAFQRKITELLNLPAQQINEAGALTPAILTLTPEAKAAWVAYHDSVERELASGGKLSDVRDVASKSADNAARLAALFQMMTDGGEAGAISAEAFERASRIAAWYLHEARRFLGELALPVEAGDAVRVDDWLIGHCKRSRTHMVPTREVQQYGPVRAKEKLAAALEYLEELHRVQVVQDGRRRTVMVNPALLDIPDQTVATVATVAVATPATVEVATPATVAAQKLRDYYEDKVALYVDIIGMDRETAEDKARKMTWMLAKDQGASWSDLREALRAPALPNTADPVDRPPYDLPREASAPLIL